MRRWGHIMVTLRTGNALHRVPNHLDCLAGATRRVMRMDGGSVDRVLRRWGNGFRATGVYHARRSLGTIGQQHIGFDDLEERLGLSRTYRVEIGDPQHTNEVVMALRDLAVVETASADLLAYTPLAKPSVMLPSRPLPLSPRDVREPHERVHGPQALAIEPGDERVTIAVVDTGVSLGHPEFQRKLLAGYDCVDLGFGRLSQHVRLIGDSQGYDFSPRDATGHGSSVCGVLGAQGWRIPRGIGGRSLVLPIRVLAAARVGKAPKLVGVGSITDIEAGVKIAADLGADVINCSFGTPDSAVDPHGPKPHSLSVAYATHLECVLVAASGNSGRAQAYYPAALPQVIAVGSVDREGRRSKFSTFGPHLTLCAPGERIVSPGRRNYRVSQGTSFAAPFVSGVAALMVSHTRKQNRELRGREVKQLLMASATRLSDDGFSQETGYGLLDAVAALRHLDAALSSSQPPGRLR